MARTQVDHYIPFFGRDFYASTAMWTAEEVGHYIRLLVIQWDSGGLPSDLERLELVSPGVGRVWKLLSSTTACVGMPEWRSTVLVLRI
jgi:hypothetical protein